MGIVNSCFFQHIVLVDSDLYDGLLVVVSVLK